MKSKDVILNLRSLEIFIKVAEQKGFSKAAKELSLSQPTVSEHIQNLEKSLGIKLFDRIEKEAYMTGAANLLYKYARNILSLEKEAIKEIDKMLGRIKGDLVIGASSIPGVYILPNIIIEFKKIYNNINIDLRIKDSQAIIDDLIGNVIEFGIVGTKVKNEKLDYLNFLNDEIILVLPGKGDKKVINLHELRKIPLIIREEGSGSLSSLEKSLRNIGIVLSSLNIVAKMSSTEAIKQGIRAGLGGSFISKRAVMEELNSGNFRECHIKGLEIKRKFFILMRKSKVLSPIGETFFKLLTDSRRNAT